jgi:four helix bundle protein
MSLAEACYRTTAGFPEEERYGLSSQVRRAAVSIPANIAEGYGRESTASYIQFLRIAQGSQKELETLLQLCQRIGILKESDAGKLFEECERVSKMLRNLVRALQAAS